MTGQLASLGIMLGVTLLLAVLALCISTPYRD